MRGAATPHLIYRFNFNVSNAALKAGVSAISKLQSTEGFCSVQQ
jgi:hypothetical protein